jgi:hypothetical protein
VVFAIVFDRRPADRDLADDRWSFLMAAGSAVSGGGRPVVTRPWPADVVACGTRSWRKGKVISGQIVAAARRNKPFFFGCGLLVSDIRLRGSLQQCVSFPHIERQRPDLMTQN